MFVRNNSSSAVTEVCKVPILDFLWSPIVIHEFLYVYLYTIEIKLNLLGCYNSKFSTVTIPVCRIFLGFQSFMRIPFVSDLLEWNSLCLRFTEFPRISHQFLDFWNFWFNFWNLILALLLWDCTFHLCPDTAQRGKNRTSLSYAHFGKGNTFNIVHVPAIRLTSEITMHTQWACSNSCFFRSVVLFHHIELKRVPWLGSKARGEEAESVVHGTLPYRKEIKINAEPEGRHRWGWTLSRRNPKVALQSSTR